MICQDEPLENWDTSVTRLSMGTELDSEMAVQEREIKLLLLYFEGLDKLKHLKNYD